MDKPRLLALIVIYLILFTALLGYTKGSSVWGLSNYRELLQTDAENFENVNLSDLDMHIEHGNWYIQNGKLISGNASFLNSNEFYIDRNIVHILKTDPTQNFEYSTFINISKLKTCSLEPAIINLKWKYEWELNKEDNKIYFKRSTYIIGWISYIVADFDYNLNDNIPYQCNISTSLSNVKDKNFVNLYSSLTINNEQFSVTCIEGNNIISQLGDNQMKYYDSLEFYEFGLMTTKSDLEIESISDITQKTIKPSVWDITKITLQIITFTAPSEILLPSWAIFLCFYIPSLMAIAIAYEMARGI